MGSDNAYYLRMAEECEARAAEQVDENLRQGWLHMAREWRALAEPPNRRPRPEPP
jgi:hypothetical protein